MVGSLATLAPSDVFMTKDPNSWDTSSKISFVPLESNPFPQLQETLKATDIQADDADHSRGYLVFSGECKDNVRPEIPHPIYEDIPR